MEALIVILVLGFIGLALAGPVVALFAWSRTSRLQRQLDELEREVRDLRRAARPPRPVPEAPPVADEPPLATTAAPVPPPAERPAVAPRPPVPPRPLVPDAVGPAAAVAARSADFATNLGPKILVATGALAFTVFLGLFVKYAWDNNWVGPAGRVLAGAVFGLALLALGLRLIRTQYRPLAQGQAAAGIAGLYVSAFAAHGFYGLVPREVSGLVMIAITAAAVALSVRLDARLLAALAWTGGYLTPILMSTGVDRGEALFLYLALLGAGALVVDNRRPWPETAPLAMLGTVILYMGWVDRFFRPERFEVAAIGLVVLTALFGFGMARKQRALGMAVVITSAAMGAALLAAEADRPLPLLVLSLALAAGALRAAFTMGRGLAIVAVAACALPYVVWGLSHYRADAFGIAAVWLVLAALLFVVFEDRAPAGDGAVSLAPVVLGGSAIASAALCWATDRPLPVAALVAALAGLAVLLRTRWHFAELAGVLSALVSVALWMSRFFDPTRAGDASLIALPPIAIFLAALLARGLVAREPLAGADMAAHLLLALGSWWFAYTVLEVTRPALEGPVAVGIAAAYLAVGLVARRGGAGVDLRFVRVTLGLAAAFLTLAIPVQLGFHGITLGWAAEGIVLLALGVRFASDRLRAAAYAVLFLCVLRLVVFHLPLHVGPFRPVMNPAFGTWLAVVVALGLALWVTRSIRAAGEHLDATLGPIVAGTAIVLLFGLLTGETQSAYAQQQRIATEAGDGAAALAARRAGGLMVSVLWTVFATALLAAGLAARSRGLFYAAYALFAVTSAKVVGWDLDTFSTPYRMFAFLALGLLLMAGAYLNLRFRQRLLPAPVPET